MARGSQLIFLRESLTIDLGVTSAADAAELIVGQLEG